MRRKNFLILVFLVGVPLTAWGQAAAEYGLTASKSAAAAASVAGKLSAATSAAAVNKTDATVHREVTKAPSAPRAKRTAAAPSPRPQDRPATSPPIQTPADNRPAQISIVGGGTSAKTQDHKAKYPTVIELAPSNPGAPPSKAPPQ